MKYLALFFLIIVSARSFGQAHPHNPVIEAKHAYQHVGETVEVRDSIYSGKIVDDTTAVFLIGEKSHTPRLKMIYISRNYAGVTTKIDPRIVWMLQRSKIYIYGVVKGDAQSPQITVDGATGHIGFPTGRKK